MFCGQSSSQPFQFEWTFDPGRLLGIASSLDHNDVWVWWHAIHHNFLLGSMSMTMGGPPTSGASRSTPNGSPPSSTSSGSMQKMSK